MARLEEQSPPGAGLIEAYGSGGFSVAGMRHQGAVLLLPGRALPWTVESVEDITLDTLSGVTAIADDVDILLIGCGPTIRMIPVALRNTLFERHGIAVEFMDTGAACRTYNMLRLDQRQVAAALLPV